MQSDYVIIGLSFFEGLALIISPCILPILPIILAGSLTGGVKRPLGIITGFIFFFTLFTFFSRELVLHAGIDVNVIRHVSYFILLLLGIVMMSNWLTEKFTLLTARLTSAGSSWQTVNNVEGGFWSGVVFGCLISIVWTPCAGPILAAVIVQTLLQQSTITGFFALLSFSFGVGIPMLLIALFGRNFLAHFNFVKARTAQLRKIAGLIVIVCVGYIINIDYGFINITPKQLDVATSTRLLNGLNNPYPAPAIDGATAWINSPPLTMAELKGKVILIDFWTYSCINCIRTLPYIKGWYEKYHDKGLVIIGVHSPEFEFEKVLANVQNAVRQDGILYPVAQDNNFRIWKSYANQYWPAHYLIDKNGYVVYTHFGEGDYAVTENNIRYLLNINEVASVDNSVPLVPPMSLSQTPETYFGYNRAAHYSSPEVIQRDVPAKYSLPATLRSNDWGLQGKWTIMGDRIVSAENNASLTIHFYASHVYVVAGNANNVPVSVTVQLNGKSDNPHLGRDVKNNVLLVNQHTLYEIATFNTAEEGTLTLTAATPGLELYTFTFG